MKRPVGRIRVGILRQVGTTRSPSSTLMSRHLRIFWQACLASSSYMRVATSESLQCPQLGSSPMQWVSTNMASKFSAMLCGLAYNRLPELPNRSKMPMWLVPICPNLRFLSLSVRGRRCLLLAAALTRKVLSCYAP